MYYDVEYEDGFYDGYYDYLEGYNYHDCYEQYGWDAYCEGYKAGWYTAIADCEEYGIW